MTRSGHLRAGATKWKNVHLKSTAQFINGRAFKPSEWATRGLPIVRIQNLTNSTNTYNYCDFPVDPKHVIGDGQLLFAWSGTLGAFIWRGGKAVLNQHIFRVEVNSEIINKMYLYYVLNYKTINFAKKTHGTGMTHITKSKFENSEIPLPTVAEQRRVVAKIESIFAEIDSAAQFKNHNGCNTKNLSVNFDNLKSSILTCAYTKNEWHSSELSNFLLEKSQYGANAPSVRYNTNLPRYIRITDINNDGTLDDTKKVSVQLTNENNFVLDDGDMLFA